MPLPVQAGRSGSWVKHADAALQCDPHLSAERRWHSLKEGRNVAAAPIFRYDGDSIHAIGR